MYSELRGGSGAGSESTRDAAARCGLQQQQQQQQQQGRQQQRSSSREGGVRGIWRRGA